MTSLYVLDTSVIIAEGKKALYSFEENDVVLPRIVVRELQSKRHDPELGYTARSVLREILVLMRKGDITEGIPLGEGLGNLKIEINHVDTSGLSAATISDKTNDVRILAVAKSLQKELQIPVTLVTRDIELQILAKIEDVSVEDMSDSEDASADKYISGLNTYHIDDDLIDDLYHLKHTTLTVDVPINTGVILKSHDHSKSALAIARPQWKFELVKDLTVSNYSGRSAEQKILVDHLTNNNIGVVSVSGTAGSGKSFLMLAAGLDLVRDPSTDFKKIIVFRPVNPVGGAPQDLGFLPGDINEKLAPHAQAVYDTLGTIVSGPELEKIKREGILEIGSISHVRGRTLANCVVILDELQNVEASTILTLISRLGVNARVFIGWDTAQRDARFIGKYDGIYKVVRKLYGHKLFAHVTLKKSERSPISEMVSGLLEDM